MDSSQYPTYQQGYTESQSGSGNAFNVLLLVSAAVLIIFSYLTYSFYQGMAGTKYTAYTAIMLAPVFISALLIIMIVLMGKDTVNQEIKNFLGK